MKGLFSIPQNLELTLGSNISCWANFYGLQMAQNSKCFWHLITLSSCQKIRILNLKKKFGRTQLRPIYCHSFFCHAIVLKQFEARRRATRRGRTVQPDWVIFTLWATIQSWWQQLFYQNCPHCKVIFVKVSKSFIFIEKSYLGTF